MRGGDAYDEAQSASVNLEVFVPAKHPLRPIRQCVNQARVELHENISAMHEADGDGGRPSIGSEKLMRAVLLQVLYSVRSERWFVEKIQYNLLFRRFISLAIEDSVRYHLVLSKSHDLLIEHNSVTELFNAKLEMADKRGPLSGEHFSMTAPHRCTIAELALSGASSTALSLLSVQANIQFIEQE